MDFTYDARPDGLGRADHLLVVAAQAHFGSRRRAAAWLRAWTPDAALVTKLAAHVTPGLLGAAGSSLTTSGTRVTVAVLADATSRHATPSRAEAIRKVVAAANLDAGATNAVLLVLDDAAHVLAACNAVGRALPRFTRKSGARQGGTLALRCVTVGGDPLPIDAATRDVVTRAREAAVLVDTPPTELDPAALAAAAKATLRGLRGVRVRELVGNALLQAKLGGVHAVGRCALTPPRVLIAQCGPARGQHVALVGKGITYDTGGLHLKARGAMETMKADMGGAAAVLGAFAVLARKTPPCRLSLVLCLAENAIGPAAYKPDDVLTLHSGKTVEINNTDAEGRLLLADGCSYAARVLGATTVLDAATLTGAQGIATGDLHAAIVTNDDTIERTLVAAGQSTGDLCWPLPFAPEFHRAEFTSPIADMRNSVKNRSNAQSSCAAGFVHWHLDGTDVRWGHVDLAYPAFRGERGTGFGVALLADAVRRLAAR